MINSTTCRGWIMQKWIASKNWETKLEKNYCEYILQLTLHWPINNHVKVHCIKKFKKQNYCESQSWNKFKFFFSKFTFTWLANYCKVNCKNIPNIFFSFSIFFYWIHFYMILPMYPFLSELPIPLFSNGENLINDGWKWNLYLIFVRIIVECRPFILIDLRTVYNF